MNSMTGYVFLEKNYEDYQISIAIRSLNTRFLEVNVSLPKALSMHEAEFIALLKKVVLRGSVTVYIDVIYSQAKVTLTSNPQILDTALETVKMLSERHGVSVSIGLYDLLQIKGISFVKNSEQDLALLEHAKSDFASTIKTFVETRRREGETIARDLFDLGHRIKKHLAIIKEALPEIQATMRLTLEEKLSLITESSTIDREFLMRELGILLLKQDTHEEQQRLSFHLETFLATLTQEEPVGKALDFIAQELQREITTLGNKVNNSFLQDQAIQIKGLIDKIREQVRNVE